MKLVRMLAALVVTVALAFVLAGCNNDGLCSTSPGGNTTCNNQSPDEHSLIHDDGSWRHVKG